MELRINRVQINHSRPVLNLDDNIGFSKISKGDQWRIQDFPEEGAPTPQGGAPTYGFAKISQKPHEIERIWTPGGGARVPCAPLRSATGDYIVIQIRSNNYLFYSILLNHPILMLKSFY